MVEKNRLVIGLLTIVISLSVFTIGLIWSLRETRRQAEQRQEMIDASEDRQLAILSLIESFELGFAIIGPQSEVRSWNPAMEKLSGWTEVEVVGKPIWTIMEPEDARRWKEAYPKAIVQTEAGRVVHNLEGRILNRDNRPVPVRSNVYVVHSIKDPNESYAIALVSLRNEMSEAE